MNLQRWTLTILIALFAFHFGGTGEPQRILAENFNSAPKPFPTRGILPKEEIGALRFLDRHPEFDGRGVVVAIFDTGVDPGAPGLRMTTIGKPKIIDMIDGTGSGDVATTTVRKAERQTLQGLSGRTLKLPSDWKNPSGRFHLGIKRGYDLFPRRLVGRLKQQRRKKFDLEQRNTEAALRRQIEEWDTADKSSRAGKKQERSDLEARLEQLKTIETRYDDPGPVYDCVVFHDGKVWRAAIDTDEDGDLTDEKLLTDYRAERQYATFGGNALLNFAVNIYEEGKCLSIVADSGAHGTHVAGIVAGHFPDHPELNGIAPGAQLVSVKIGDARIGSMETGAGLVRGLKAVIRNRCDLINMSYGEPTSTPNQGRLISLFEEVVNKHGVIFVASAGNSGPALSTVGAPGGTTSAIIGVGAYVSPEMMVAEYALRRKLPGMPYTWTSRGPAADGDLGVNIFAPGGAIAPVPNWTLNRSRLMNGTSMASPNACGAIALILSGLKSDGIPYSPHSVRRALANTAHNVQQADVFAQGPGLLQVDRTFESLKQHADDAGEMLRFAVDLPDRDNARGIYLRENHETRKPLETRVSLRPLFDDKADNRSKLDFEMRFALQTTEPWVQTGEHLMLTHGGRIFQVHVNPSELEPGVHFAEVRGYDTASPQRGPIFRLPITVIRTVEPSDENSSTFAGRLEFEPGRIVRRFFAVPDGATWADLTLRSQTPDGQRRRFVIHPVQILPGESDRDSPTRRYVTLPADTEVVRSFAVIGGHTLELCLAQYWSSLGSSKLDYKLTFHGLVPDFRRVTLHSDQPATRVEVASVIGREQLAPSAVLKTLRKVIRPRSSVIRPLSPTRDRLPDGRQIYQLLLTYEFEQKQSGTVTPRFPQTDGLLYDSPFGTQLWMLFDAGKRRVAADDVWPSPIKLGKGRHVLRLQLRHTDVSELEKVKDMLLSLDRPLSKSLSLDVYPSRAAAASGGPKFKPRAVNSGRRVTLFVAAPPMKRLPASAKAGDILLGSVTYGKTAASLNGARQSGFPIDYVVPISPSSGSATSAKSDDRRPPAKKLEDELRDFKVAQLKKLSSEETAAQFHVLAGKLLEEYPAHLPVLVAVLHRRDDVKHRKQRLADVVEAADAVLALIDTPKLALHFGTKVNPDDEDAVAMRQQMDTTREILVDTLYRKGRALGYMELPDVIEKHPVADPKSHDKAFEANFAELRKWVDTTDQKYFLLHVRRESRKGRYGNALKLLNEQIPTSAPNFMYIKKRRDLYEKLGWKHCWDYEKRWLVIRFPQDYEAF
jgi:tripeptidyl-peptidase-2